MIRERAPAKVNLLLHVGGRRDDGLHELCSLFASVSLADEVVVEPAERDQVVCPGVGGTNLAGTAVALFRRDVDPSLPPLRVEIAKRIPVAAGLGGGSADAAAVLRAANELAGRPLDPAGLRALGFRLGADLPSQIEPRHALVTRAGEAVEPIELPAMSLLLVPDGGGRATDEAFTRDSGGNASKRAREGLSTADVYREADRLGATRTELDVDFARALAQRPLAELAASLENDLEPAAMSLRPDLADRMESLLEAGALAARVTGSGPTVFGVFRPGEAPDVAGAARVEVE